MIEVDAIYEAGVFKPLGAVPLKEKQRVRLQYQPLDKEAAQKWLEEVKAFQQKIVAERGYFPDSTPLIAEDRMRDV